MLVKVTITPDESSGVQGEIPSLIDATSDELLYGLSQNMFSSVDLVNVSCYIFLQMSVQRHHQLTYFQAYHARTNDVNPALKAIMEFNPDAWVIARQLDEERAQNRLRG
jgi:amidase